MARIERGPRTRFEIADPLLKELIVECMVAFSSVYNLFESIWIYRRRNLSKSLRKYCIQWYCRLFGDKARRSSSYLLFYDRKRSEFQKLDINERIEKLKYIDRVKNDYKDRLKLRYKSLTGTKYTDIRGSYSIITEALLEMIFPEFLRKSLFLNDD